MLASLMTLLACMPPALDVPAVLQALAQRAKTTPGAVALTTAKMAPTLEATREQYALVAEAMSLQPDDAPPIHHPLDLGNAIGALQTHNSLEMGALADAAQAVESLVSLSQWSATATRTPRLAALAASAAPPPRLAIKLGGQPRPFVQLPSGGISLSSEAFPMLRSRRAAVRSAVRKTTGLCAAVCTPKLGRIDTNGTI